MSATADLLLEIGTEELPPADVRPALQQLETGVRRVLGELRIQCARVQAFGTPRRLVVFGAAVSTRQRPAVRDVKGPAARIAYEHDGRPTQAAIGFARSQGIPVEALHVAEVDGGRYVVASLREPGRSTTAVLPHALGEVVSSLAFSKTMRWGAGEARFARPVRWVLALFGSQVLRLEVAGVRAGRKTYGHRVLSPGMRTISHPPAYFRLMRRSFVILDPDERQRRIVTQSKALTAEIRGVPLVDPHLLEETVMTAEHPVALRGKFSREFLSLPPEVLITVMQHHQKYFPVEDRQHRLLPYFIAIRDGGPHHLSTVRESHEWVLWARFADARFFIKEDRTHRLEDYVPALEGLVLQAQLGTMADKTRRLIRLAAHVAQTLGLDRSAQDNLERAARSCKADLVTRLVGEFPELQGVIGGIYATLDGEPIDVAQAIGEHYRPAGAGDRPPTTLTGALLGLVDRCDTLVGAFAAGLAPTGSQDPYGLRRAGQGVIEIIWAHNLSLSLSDLVGAAAAGFGKVAREGIDAVLEFLQQRLRALLVDRGIRYDLVDAALAASGVEILGAAERAHALQAFAARAEFAWLYTAYDRASRILTAAAAPTPDPRLFESQAERILYERATAVQTQVAAAVQAREYGRALEALGQFVAPVDRFFEDVLVMAPDPQVRANRLALLRLVVTVFRVIADFSKVVMNEESRAYAASAH